MTTDIGPWVREARRLDAEIKAMAETKASLESKIKEVLAVGEIVTVDDVVCVLRAGNRKFNEKAALALMPVEIQVKCIVKAVDPKLVRQFADEMGITDAAMDPAGEGKSILKLTG